MKHLPEPFEDLSKKSLSELACLVQRDWKRVWYGAVPYLSAMGSLESIEDMFMYDSGRTVVAYFLSNAGTWRGPVARLVKKELNRRLAAPPPAR
jgi:hypothetical protein